MVAVPAKKRARTATHFEQRFNVAMSRARDRLYLVRSVREGAKCKGPQGKCYAGHMREPIKGRVGPSGDLMAACGLRF